MFSDILVVISMTILYITIGAIIARKIKDKHTEDWQMMLYIAVWPIFAACFIIYWIGCIFYYPILGICNGYEAIKRKRKSV